jgi:hypothetical protein
MKKLVPVVLAAAILPAAAQDAPPPLKVLYQPSHVRNAYLLDKAMDAALARPAFIKTAMADAQTLAVSVPQFDYHLSTGDNISFSFTLHFARDGNTIGEAEEECVSNQVEDCAGRIASDLAAANAIHR